MEGIRSSLFHVSPRRSRRRNAVVGLSLDDTLPALMYMGLSDSTPPDHRLGLADRTSTPLPHVSSVDKLVDLSAQVAAKHIGCESLEENDPPLDEALLKKVAYWAFPQDERPVQAFANLTDKFNEWDKGVNMVLDSKIKDMYQVGFMAAATVSSSPLPNHEGTEVRVSLMFEKQKIVSSKCSNCKDQIWCFHVIAAIIYRIRFPEKVSVHAPMTETLSTLNRDQLQKLLQYAVQEDPAGVLGKVFRYLDEIRDSSSEMNIVSGAPDPTFGAPQGIRTQWELSLETLEKNMVRDLDKMTEMSHMDTTNSFYPNTYDMVEKADSTMYGYLQKALDLAQQSEMASASQVLIRITQCTFTALEENNDWRCSNLARFCHDLEQIYAMFVLSPNVQGKEQLVSMAREFNRRGKHVSMYLLPHSQWAECPPLDHVVGNRIFNGFKGCLFFEPLCAAVVQPWSSELETLLSGNAATISQCTYDEDVVIMMSRLNSLLYTGTGQVFAKMARLATVILRKLLKMAEQYSLLSRYRESKDINLADLFPTVIPPTSKSTTEPDLQILSGKGKSLRKGEGRIKSSTRGAKRHKNNNTETKMCNSKDTCLTQAEISYCIIYLCDIIIRIEKLSDTPRIDENFLSHCILLGLELSRFRTATDRTNCSLLEHNWLWTMERSLVEYAQRHTLCMEDAVFTHIDALCEQGCEFYDGVYPLVLIDTLLTVVPRCGSLEKRLGDRLIQMCARLLLDTSTPLDVFTLPVSFDSFIDNPPLFVSGIEDICEGSLTRKHRDFAAKKFHAIIETFLSKVDASSPSNKKLIAQVLEHFESLRDVRLLQLITRDLRLQLIKLKEAGQLDSCLRIVINTIRLGKTRLQTLQSFFAEQKDKEFLLSLASGVGVNCLKLFVNDWKSFLHTSEVKRLLMTLQPQINTNCRSLPREVVTLIMQYYEVKERHDDDACTLLSFFKPGDSNYTKAVKKILANATSYHCYALFELAKLQFQSRKKGKTTTDVMDDATFEIVELAFKGINREPWSSIAQPKTYEYLDWVYKLCTVGSVKDIAKSSIFKQLVKVLCQHASEHPSLLLCVLQHLEKTPQLLKQAAFIGTTLIDAYKIQFDRQFQDCGHAAYDKVISEMVKARLHCKQYVKGGDTKFDSVVLESVKSLHAKKKKVPTATLR